MSFGETLKALSDKERREILELLKKGKMSAGEISSHFDMTNATISYHLSILKKAGLVFEEKEKNFVYYQLNTTVLEEVMLWIKSLKEEDDNGKDQEE
ncbi:MAG: winged helix-turn-helix transcriptional regulator [Erysipelotrichaceae bacterium]|nr:winged helix-turn-helix transcriptional regulator [Erysipelotrichaceae bacterium]